MEAEHESAKDVAPKSGRGPRSQAKELAPIHPVHALQQQVGNRAVQALLRKGTIQAKLAISNRGDPAEQEADRVADHVMREPKGFPISAPSSCAEGDESCEAHTQPGATIQRRAGATSAQTGEAADGASAESLSDLLPRGSGQPLDATARAFFEPRLGHDLSGVRVHTGSAAAESAQSIDALAYTAGHDVVFNQSQYDPTSSTGRKLLAHELTHVIQQGRAPARSGAGRLPLRQNSLSPKVQRQDAQQGQPAPTKHLTQDDAARAALTVANPSSIRDNLEYAGLIYKVGPWNYNFSGPIRGTDQGANPANAPAPAGTTVVGDYHTHGDYSVAGPGGKAVRTSDPNRDDFNSDHFSSTDKTGIAHDAAGKPEYRGYLGTPSRRFLVYNPNTGQEGPL
jgi:hypothetical protein